MMSSHHAPYVLGYTRATMETTIRCNFEKMSQSKKVFIVQIVD